MAQIWKCSGNDIRTMPQELWEKDLSILSNPKEMSEVLLFWKELENRKEMVLPLVQNLEGAVLGAGVMKRENYWTTGDYPFSTLKEIEPDQFSLMKDDRIQAVLAVIKTLRDEPLILEVEAPFSVLASLVNPMDLYLSMQAEPELLENILKRIVSEESKYIEAGVQAGCHIFSMAEPAGTLDMVGEKYFKECSGKAAVMLLKEIEGFLSGSVVHLCGKLSSSMIAVQMAEEEEYSVNSEEYLENLLEIAKNPEIHFVGQRCIHQKKNRTGIVYVLKLSVGEYYNAQEFKFGINQTT
ncbi:MAG: uroporphyrinogen decarboxylase family protein [Lachnospiraceae bacterium]|nr:uroporphyrinogen decarboxylase family protein [Lachnospiraceae bacterium]